MIDKLEQGFADMRPCALRGGELDGNVSCYIDNSMVFPAGKHYPHYLV